MKNEDILALLQKQVSPLIKTTEVRMMDSLDFHDCHIRSLVDLVKAAYERGRDMGYEEGMEVAQEMAAVYSRECGN
jgi:hypothetical protein